MKDRVLCVCHTPIQLLNMMNLLQTEFPDAEYDLVLTDSIKNCDVLKKNIENSHFFRNVYLFYDSYKDDVMKYKNKLLKLFAYIRYCRKTKRALNLKKVYTNYLFGNWDFLSIRCFFWTENPNLIWCDEGTACYSFFLPYIYRKSLADYLHRIPAFNRHIAVQYLYRPELAEMEVPFVRKKLPYLIPGSKFAAVASQLFGFTKDDFISEKYIYFDGAYSEDSIRCNDRELLSMVADIVGKENLLVKVHPRSSTEWYSEQGYHINTNTSIPWEIYCMNPDAIAGKVLVSVFSTALLSPWMYFDNPMPCISLMKMFDSDALAERHKNLVGFVNNVFEKHPEIYMLPRNKEELKEMLETK